MLVVFGKFWTTEVSAVLLSLFPPHLLSIKSVEVANEQQQRRTAEKRRI